MSFVYGDAQTPTFYKDFTQEFSLSGTGIGPDISFTRSGSATFFNSSGNLTIVGANVPRFDYDPVTRQPRGLLIEGSRENSIRNSQGGGATNGVIGSGGVAPTNWFVWAQPAGITREVVATGSLAGFNYIDLKFSGTPSSDGQVIIYFDSTWPAASVGQSWTSSVYAALIAGDQTNITALRITVEESSGSFLAASTTWLTSIGTNLSRFAVTRTFNNASVTIAAAYVTFNVTTGNPINLTIRIAAPQLELGAFATSYIPTTNAAVSRGADVAVVTQISSFWNNEEGTVFAEAFIERYGGAFPAILQFNNGTNSTDHWLLFYFQGGNQIALGSTDFTLTVGNLVLSTVHKYAGGVSTNSGRGYLNGTASNQDTSITMVSNKVRLDIGGQVGGVNFLNGYIRKVGYWPRRLSNFQLQQLTR